MVTGYRFIPRGRGFTPNLIRFGGIFSPSGSVRVSVFPYRNPVRNSPACSKEVADELPLDTEKQHLCCFLLTVIVLPF